MAEYLVYNTITWMDRLTAEQVMKLESENENFRMKYDARYKKGHIVDVKPDGYWTGPNARGFRKDVFCVVSKPTEKENVDLAKSEVSVSGEIKTLIKKSQYEIDLKSVVLDNNKIGVLSIGNSK